MQDLLSPSVIEETVLPLSIDQIIIEKINIKHFINWDVYIEFKEDLIQGMGSKPILGTNFLHFPLKKQWINNLYFFSINKYKCDF